VYTRLDDVHWNGNVDIRFYTSLEKDINNGCELCENDIQYVQTFLGEWFTDFMNEFKHVLPAQFTLLFGSFHSRLIQAARRVFDLPDSFTFHPWVKYLFSSDRLPPMQLQALLPKDIYISTIFTQDFDLILSSSAIPRTKRYLETRILSSTALYRSNTRDSAPIAFCITAPDRSLSTLWVDPCYRGRGLGKYVARQRLLGSNGMLRQSLGTRNRQSGVGEFLIQSGNAGITSSNWSHADIAANNIGSKKICDWLGGISGWTVVWVKVSIIKGENGVFKFQPG
jgi:ribosomal protein S18 acetylase RimI-like enzyme